MAEKTVKEKLYIVRHDGISLPGIKSDDVKLGVTVKLLPEVGDAYCKRGFLQDADTVVETESVDSRLLRENERLKEENAKLKEQVANLKK